MQRYLDLFISINCSTGFKRFPRPSSGAQICTYSVRYCQTDTAACCYRSISSTIATGSSTVLTIPDAVCIFYTSAGEQPQAARLLRSWVQIPPGSWIFVCCECRVLSGRGLGDELITRPEESYRLCCVVVCDLETSRIGAAYIYIYMTLEA
jgi:hypothetical protein